MKNRMFSLFIGLLFSLSAKAAEVRENYNGVRSLGMGGAGIAVVNDETALMLNPAALGKLRDSYGTIIDPEMDGSSNDITMYNSEEYQDPFDISQVKDTVNVTRNKLYHTRGQLFPSFVLRNFGIGVLGRKILDAQMNTLGTQMQTYYQDDISVHLGVSLKFFDGRVKIGAMGKMISRIEIDKALDPTATLDVSSNSSEGVGIGGDIGLILAAPVALLPTLSIVGRDIGSTAFTAGSGVRGNTATRPVTLTQDYDVALAIFPIHSNNSRSSFTVEAQKVIEMGRALDRTRYYHVGYEYNYGDVFFMRAGMNQKFWTAGIELASERTQIQIASYGEEVGVDGGSSEEDRRYVVKLSYRF